MSGFMKTALCAGICGVIGGWAGYKGVTYLENAGYFGKAEARAGVGVLEHSLYGSKAADELAAAADKDKDGLLESGELADLLKALGWKGAPVPAHAVPHFQVGGTKDLEVVMNYAMNGPSLSVRVPKEAAEKYLGR
jgi:hypothetical protein